MLIKYFERFSCKFSSTLGFFACEPLILINWVIFCQKPKKINQKFKFFIKFWWNLRIFSSKKLIFELIFQREILSPPEKASSVSGGCRPSPRTPGRSPNNSLFILPQLMPFLTKISICIIKFKQKWYNFLEKNAMSLWF